MSTECHNNSSSGSIIPACGGLQPLTLGGNGVIVIGVAVRSLASFSSAAAQPIDVCPPPPELLKHF